MIRSSLFSYIDCPEQLKQLLKQYMIEEYIEKRSIYIFPEVNIASIKDENPSSNGFWSNPYLKLTKFLSKFNSKNSKLIIKERSSLKDELTAMELYNPDLSKDRRTNCINIKYLKANPITKFITTKGTDGFYLSELSELNIPLIKTAEVNILRYEIQDAVIELSKLEAVDKYFIQLYIERDLDLRNINEGIKLLEKELEKVAEEISILHFKKLPPYMF